MAIVRAKEDLDPGAAPPHFDRFLRIQPIIGRIRLEEAAP
jgi:hypothetical protein